MFKKILFLLIFITISSCVFANGCIMPDYSYTGEITLPEQKAVLYWDGNQEELIISTKFNLDDLTNIAWVVPIQSSVKPVIEEADETLFFDLLDLFDNDNSYYSKGDGFAMAESAQYGVQVIETKTIDIYDLTILKADNSQALLNWLTDNNFYFPYNKINVLDYYVNNALPYYFVANKINLENKFPNYKVTTAEKICAYSVAEKVKDELYYSDQLFEQLDDLIYFFMGDTSICNNVDANVATLLTEVNLGMSTPLKYTFTPATPTYPMHMTSINEGKTNVSLFVIGDTPFKDKTSLLTYEDYIFSAGSLQSYGYEEKYVTKLYFDDNTTALTGDSFFVEKEFKPYVPQNGSGWWLIKLFFKFIFTGPFGMWLW